VIGYYDHIRSDILPLLPPDARRIVDVGCSAGGTLAWLRKRYPNAHTIGLEGNSDLKNELSRNADEAHIVDLTKEIPDLGKPDLMLFLDILEHLPDPETVLRRITDQLSPDGTIIVSVPNVAHLSVALPLILFGAFQYRDAGILDRTHLRFFVQQSAIELLSKAGFRVDRGLLGGLGRRDRLADRLTFGLLRRRLTKQFILRGIREETRTAAPIRWELV
jgi:trans-aconitate methyltransferase